MLPPCFFQQASFIPNSTSMLFSQVASTQHNVSSPPLLIYICFVWIIGQGVPERVGELKKSSEFENQNLEAPTSKRRLKIVLKKGKGLLNVHWIHSLKTRPIFFIGREDGELDDGSQKHKPEELNRGSNPEWKAYGEFSVSIDEAWLKKHYLFVTVESKRKIRPGSKFVGECKVSIEDLLNDYGDAVDKKEHTRVVMNKKGEVHGLVTFEYEFVRTPDPQTADPPLPQTADPPLPDSPLPQPGNSNGHPFLRGFAGEVAGKLFDTVIGMILGAING